MKTKYLFSETYYKQVFLKSKLAEKLYKIILPGFGGVPLLGIVWFFVQRMKGEAISMRAASIAYRFFVALIPALIVIFNLIPYIPISNIQIEILNFIEGFIPKSAYETVQSTIEDIVLTRRSTLLSFGFVLTLYFASNGINALFTAFNPHHPRNMWKTYLVSFLLTFLIAFMFVAAISLQVGGEYIMWYLKKIQFVQDQWIYTLIWWFKLFTTLFLALSTISVLYYYGTAKNERFRFFSPGAFLSTIFIIVTSYAFGYYVENFAQYNKLYGSLGTIMVIMMWLYLNAIGLITGYEFNQGVKKAQKETDKLSIFRHLKIKKANK